ncbi:MAG: hypothetical protein WB698_05610 [Solirubrobacteraceae bacterium]
MFDAVSTVEELSTLERLLDSLNRDGREFELLCRWFLQNDPEFAAEYETYGYGVSGLSDGGPIVGSTLWRRHSQVASMPCRP